MKKSYIELICDKCLKKYQIRKSSYYRRKQFNRPNLCNDCMHKYVGNRNKEVWQNKSSEEKIYHAKQSSEINKKRFANKSPEEQQLQIYKLQKGYADYINNLTSEEKDKLSEKHREVWNKKTELEKEEFIKKQQEIWNNKTLAEQMKCISRLHSGHKHYIETRTEEQRILHNNKISKGVKKAWDSMDINERKILITRAIENLNNFRKNESANNKKERYIKNSIKCRENIKNMTYNERVKNNLNTIYIKNKNAIINTQIIITNHLDKMKYDNEREFMRVLIINDIEFIYQWYNIYEHPKFKELFPNNIITGYNYVSPFHRWDFKILTNKCDDIIMYHHFIDGILKY